MNSQTPFAQALLNPELPCPSGLTTWNGSDPAQRFAVYRNNVMVSLIDALADSYPVVQELVGEEFFRAMARVFAMAHPPRSPVMAFYGQNFAEFVQAFPPAASVPYLADVARLEMARVWAYHTADVPPLALEAVHAALADPALLIRLQLTLHPSVHVIPSAFAVVDLWAVHQGEIDLATVDPDQPQAALVFRHGLAVNTLELTVGVAQFVSALQAGKTLPDAASAALELDPEFDLTQALTLLLHWQLITHLTTRDSHDEPTR
nr:DNA-binding domain-containing protein [uncultured Rhodoferax sp.]